MSNGDSIKVGDVVDATIIWSWTVAGRWPLSGREWSILELPDGHRIKRREILGAHSETVQVTIRSSDYP